MHFLIANFFLLMMMMIISTTFAANPNSLIRLRANRLLKRPPFQCPETETTGHSSGKYPFPGNCRRYYLCWKWSPSQAHPLHTIRDCPLGTLFDVRRQMCVYEKEAACHQEADLANFVCPAESVVLRNRQCDRFWLCSRWRPYLRYCPIGYKFDVVAKRCLPWMEAQCEEEGEEGEGVPSTLRPGFPWTSSSSLISNRSTTFSMTTRGSFSGRPVWMTTSSSSSGSKSSTSRRPRTSTTTIAPDTTSSSYNKTSTTTAKSVPTTEQHISSSYSSSSVPSSSSTTTTVSPVSSSSIRPEQHESNSSSYWFPTTVAHPFPPSSLPPLPPHHWQPILNSTVIYPTPKAPESLLNSSTTKTPSLVCKYVYL